MEDPKPDYLPTSPHCRLDACNATTFVSWAKWVANATHLSQSEAYSPLGENMPGNIYYASMLQETVQVREVSSE